MAAKIITDEIRSPAERVFAVPELMEAILLYLPIRQVLHAQRINKDCEAAIKSSSKLQQALFFKTFPLELMEPPKALSPEHASKYKEVIEMAQNNPLKVIPNSSTRVVIINNPFIDYIADGYWYPILAAEEPLKESLKSEERWRTAALARPEASWRRMYLTQPPTEDLDCSQKLGEVGTWSEVQRWLNERKHKLSKTFERLDYAGDLNDTLSGKSEIVEIDPDQKNVPDVTVVLDQEAKVIIVPRSARPAC